MTQSTNLPLSHRTCAVCGQQNKEPLFQQRFSNLSNGSLLSGYDVVACRECGFCFADHIPAQEAFDEYYEKMSKYEHSDSARETSTYDLGRFRTCVSFLKSFHTQPTARVLEVGYEKALRG